MSDLLSALVQRSKQVADPIASAYASGNRPYIVRITRPGAASTFDRSTGTVTNPVDELLYEGPGRLTTATGPVEVEVGEERTTLSSVRISVDTYEGKPPRVDDVVKVMSTVQSISTHLAGREFIVTGVEAGGHYGVGYVMSALGVAPSRRS